MVVVQNLLAMTASLSDDSLATGETAGIVAFLTNRNVPLAGASVSLAASPASAVDILSPSPTTTNAAGAATFTVRGRTVSANTIVTLTATATVGASTVTSIVTLTVRALAHNYRVTLSAADALSTGASSTVTATFTDKGSPVSGATVSLGSNQAALSVVTASATTSPQGLATFTVRAGYVEADTAATLTATATNGTATASSSAAVTVKAFVHAYSLTGSASASVVAANGTVTVTFTVKDAGVPRSGATVTITVSPSTAFEIQGNAQKTTDASGAASFTVRAKSVSDDTSGTVTATASNGTATNVATFGVTLVAQGAPPSGGQPTTQGIAVEIFAGVAILLAVIAAILGVLWLRARGARPPAMPPEEGAGQS
jgi:hypothetical protein